MGNTATHKAAKLLFQARKTGVKLDGFPPGLKPGSMDDVWAIIAEMDAMIPEPVAGFKFHKKPTQTRLCFAPLYASRIFSSPARVPIALASTLAVEAEICFRLKRDLPARGNVYGDEEVFDAFEACVAFEVVDSRFADLKLMVNTALNDVYADHMANGAFVFSEWRDDWRTVDFTKTRVTMTQGDKYVADQIGGHPNANPAGALSVFVNEMRTKSGLTAGMPIATGSFTSWRPVDADHEITAAFEGFGEAKMTIVR